MAADGTVLLPLGPVPSVPDGVGAVAVSLLHADRYPEHEAAVAAQLRAAGWDVTASSELAPEFREYERTVTTVLNAYLRPACRRTCRRWAGWHHPWPSSPRRVGCSPASTPRARPAALLLSGPAGGVLAVPRRRWPPGSRTQ